MVFDGKKTAERILSSLKTENEQLRVRYGRVPCLCVLLVGDDYGSQRYVASCERNAQKAGMDCKVVRLSAESNEAEVLETIRQMNGDEKVDGILIQMPLPSHLDSNRIIQSINPQKDVDGVTPANVSHLWKDKKTDYSQYCVPCTPRGVMRILQESGIEIDGKNVVVVGRSNIVGMPVSKLLLNANATVTICHSHTTHLKDVLLSADIIVSAIGKPKFIREEMVREGAVVVDVGINQDPVTGAMCGDVDTDAVAGKCSLITPVPGGVGLMTICSLMENTMDCFKHKLTYA